MTLNVRYEHLGINYSQRRNHGNTPENIIRPGMRREAENSTNPSLKNPHSNYITEKHRNEQHAKTIKSQT